MQSGLHDRYPLSTVVIASSLGIAIYAAGAVILAGVAGWVVAAYLVYCLWVELTVLRKSCVNCCYYGQRCGLGKGRLCALLFKQSDPARFAARQITWWDLLPDLLTGLVPLVVGVVLLIRRWSWLTAGLLVTLIVLMFVGNGLVRGLLLCRHCKQGVLGCPARKLFSGC